MEPRLAGIRAARTALWQGAHVVAGRPSSDDHRGVRRGLLSMAGMLVTPFVVVGYLGVAGLLVLPLLSLRGLFPRRPTLLAVRA